MQSSGICICGSRSVFQNDNMEMSLSGDAYRSEFQLSMQINKITYDARNRVNIVYFIMIIDFKLLNAAQKLAANKQDVN